MLDIAMFRENADVIRADHDRRGIPHDSIDEVIRLDEEWRKAQYDVCLLYTSPSPRDATLSRMPSSA